MHFPWILVFCSLFAGLVYNEVTNQSDDDKVCYTIYGKTGCWYFDNAKSMATSQMEASRGKFVAQIEEFNSDSWYKKIDDLNRQYDTIIRNSGRTSHRTSPFIV